MVHEVLAAAQAVMEQRGHAAVTVDPTVTDGPIPIYGALALAVEKDWDLYRRAVRWVDMQAKRLAGPHVTNAVAFESQKFVTTTDAVALLRGAAQAAKKAGA